MQTARRLHILAAGASAGLRPQGSMRATSVMMKPIVIAAHMTM
jgi:hypothetical protein